MRMKSVKEKKRVIIEAYTLDGHNMVVRVLSYCYVISFRQFERQMRGNVIAYIAHKDHWKMVHSCCVVGCTTRQRKGKYIAFHSSYADWDKAQELIDQNNLDALISDDIDSSWSSWQHEFLRIMNHCIPKCFLPTGRNCPWMNKSLLQAMRRKNAMFKLGKRTGNYAKFKYVHNKFVAKLRNAKEKFFANLDPRDKKKFWKTVKYLNNSAVSIPTLFHNDALVASDKGKANLLNSFFNTCFNISHPSLSNGN